VKKRQNPETAANDLYALAAKKLSQGVQLSAEEYRSLGVGCAGLEETSTFFQKTGKVTDVYPGSPADKAGIRVGDPIVAVTDDKTAKKEQANPDVPLWVVTLDKEGTHQDVTIIRHGKPITFSLTRINIEDIQDTNYRQKWEQMVSKLGYPQKGTFSGTSLDRIGQADTPKEQPEAAPKPTSVKSLAKFMFRMLLPV
jgi:C-terminal processing protease CtpA/Prc